MKNPAALLLLPAAMAAASAAAQTRPNFVIVFMDDLGYNDLGFRNSTFNTPNIDRFASESINFSRAYVPSPTSSPSRVGLLTGRHPLKAGFTRHIDTKETPVGTDGQFTASATDPGHMPNRAYLPLAEVTFAEVLRDAGYYTAAIGKWHLGSEAYYPDKQGFLHCYGVSDLGSPASYFPPYFTRPTQGDGKYLTDWLTDDAVKLIGSHDYAKQPLLLYFPHYGVHSPHIGKLDKTAKYLARGYDKAFANYLAMIESMDESFGRVLRAIDERGIADNTVVIFLSDQGGYFPNLPLRGGKLNATALFEGGARVPFFMRCPGYAGAREIQTPVSSMDVFPTLLDLAGINPKAQKQLDGLSLTGLVSGKKELPARPLFFYRSYDDRYSSVLRDGLKLILTRSGNDEAYDLDTDPYETRNLVADPAYASRIAKLRTELGAFLAQNELAPVR